MKKEKPVYRSPKITIKNCVLLGITLISAVSLMIGLGVFDETGSLAKSCPYLVPALLWQAVFFRVNADRL